MEKETEAERMRRGRDRGLKRSSLKTQKESIESRDQRKRPSVSEDVWDWGRIEGQLSV